MNLFGSSPSPPPAPDPAATANSQSQANINTAIANASLNRVNQQTPWGSITYTQGAPGANGVPTWSSQVQLSPQQQALLDQQQGMQLQRGDLAHQFLGNVSTAPLDFGSLPAINNRGQMYSPAHASHSQQPQGQPGSQGSQGGQSMDQIIAAAVAAAMAHQAGSPGAPAVGQPAGQPPAPGQPAGQPVGQPQPTGQPSTQPSQKFLTYQDYLNNGDYGQYGSEGNVAAPLSQDQWNALGPQQWNNVNNGNGVRVGPSDSRYQGLFSQTGNEPGRIINVSGNDPRSDPNFQLNDPSRLVNTNGAWAYSDDNQTPGMQRGIDTRNKFDTQAFLTHAVLPLVAAYAGGSLMSGAGSGAGLAGDESAGLAMNNAFTGAGSGATGGAFDGAVAGGSASGGAGGAFDGAAGGYAPVTDASSAAAGNYAPVTDLSTQAQTPSLWRQALNNVTSGRGLLGQNGTLAGRAGSALLPQILRALQNRNSQGGSQ